MFQVNEIVVYNQYVCKIKQIKTNHLTQKDYYVMNPIDDESLIIDVPVENRLGSVKKIMSKEDALKLIKKIPEIETLDIDDKFIDQRYKELMNTGIKEDLVKIIKTTYIRNENRKNNNKKISEKDSIYFAKAENLLYNELKYSLSMSFDDVKQYIIDCCK